MGRRSQHGRPPRMVTGAGTTRESQRLIASGEGEALMRQVRDLAMQLSAAEEVLLDQRIGTGEKRAQWMRSLVILLVCTAALFLLTSGLLYRKAVRRLFVAQRQSHDSEACLFATLQSCGDGLIVADTARNVTLLNPVAQALTGWRQDQAQDVR